MQKNAPLILGLSATIILLSGCLDHSMLEEPSAPEASPRPNAFSWSTTRSGDVALAFTIEPVDRATCTIKAHYLPAAGPPGMDGMVVVTTATDSSWMITGSTWHEAYAHVGIVDSRPLVEPYRDEGPIQLGWGLDVEEPTTFHFGVEGEESSARRADAHAAAPKGVERFAIKVACTAPVAFRGIALGHEALIAQTAEERSGVGAQAGLPFANPGAAAALERTRAFDAPAVHGFIGGFGEGYSSIHITGPGTEARYDFMPSLEEMPWAQFAGQGGTYTVRVPVDVDLAGGLWYTLLGLEPVASVDALAAVA